MEQRGETTIRLIPGGAAGWCYYSREISLDKALRGKDGKLWIEAAVQQPKGEILYGDASVFAESEYLGMAVLAEVGILLNKEQNAFRIGLRLLEDTDENEVKVFWRAFCKGKKNQMAERSVSPVFKETPEEEAEESAIPQEEEPKEEPQHSEEFYIESVPGQIFKGQKFMFMCHRPEDLEESVTWNVVGEDAGTINGYGMYTAPDRPGVFEVTAQAGGLLASAYIVVKDQ